MHNDGLEFVKQELRFYVYFQKLIQEFKRKKSLNIPVLSCVALRVSYSFDSVVLCLLCHFPSCHVVKDEANRESNSQGNCKAGLGVFDGSYCLALKPLL